MMELFFVHEIGSNEYRHDVWFRIWIPVRFAFIFTPGCEHVTGSQQCPIELKTQPNTCFHHTDLQKSNYIRRDRRRVDITDITLHRTVNVISRLL